MWANGERLTPMDRVEPASTESTEETAQACDISRPSDRVAAEAHERLATLFAEQVDWVWQTVRRLGLSDAEAEDATQQVFIVASRRLHDIPKDRERGFLAGTAAHVVANARRAIRRKREDFIEIELADDAAIADELLDRARARQIAERVLDAMDFELRTVFVLYELQEMTLAAIAQALALPQGTVASRLRRARAEFQRRAALSTGRMRKGGERSP